MRASTFLAPVFLGTALLACSVTSDEDASQAAAHTEDQPTYARYGWMWADDSLEEFTKNAEATAFWSTPEFLPVEHPMAQRLQFWVDQMDAALRARSPEALANTPKPQVVVRKDADPNAWVTSVPVVWKVPTRLTRAVVDGGTDGGVASDGGIEDGGIDGGVASDGGIEDGGVDGDVATDAGAPSAPPAPPALVLLNTGKIGTTTYGTPLERAVDERSVAEFVALYNRGFSSCRLASEGGAVVFGSGCAIDPEVRIDRSESLAFYATSKWLTVTTGLVTTMLDENRIVAVLAHELGHYYRTHGVQPTDELNYFYALGDANAATKPAPDARYLAQTVKLRDKLRSSEWSVDYAEENALMTEQHLGFYTTEQEADDISLELLAKIGLPPALGLDSQLQLHKIVDDLSWSSDVGDIKWEECSALRERGFKDEQGAPVSIPVGDLSDPHHSLCFRTFNMAREIAAHSYRVATARPRPSGEPFANLVFRMQSDLEAPPPEDEYDDAGVSDAGAPPSDAGQD